MGLFFKVDELASLQVNKADGYMFNAFVRPVF